MPIEKSDTRVTLSHPNGSSVEILFYGATIISWKAPSPQGSPPVERLFVSEKSALDGSKPVRGGIPIVFPVFGPPTKPEHARLPQHGFARNSKWEWQGLVMDNEAGVCVRLVLNPTPAIASIYDFPSFSLVYVVTLAGHQLTTDLQVHNTSADRILSFQALLHTYIRCDSDTVTISPLNGLMFIDKTHGNAVLSETRDLVDVKQFTDSIYQSAGGKYEIKWNDGHIAVRANGFGDVVVWNPQSAGSKMGDMQESGWKQFVCVEPGIASYWEDLGPHKIWAGQQVISVK